jgi:1,2-diacylglycerol 3-alpha-glucosyltransferase
MRVLIAGATYFPALNGQSVFMVHLAEGLAAQGHEVSVLFPGRRALSSRINGVQLETVRSLELSTVRADAYFPYFHAGRVRDIFESFRPEVLHIHDHYPLSIVAVREARRRGIPIVGTNHFVPANVEPYIPGSTLLRPVLDRLLWEWMFRVYRRLDFVTAPSQAAVNLLQSQGLHVPMRAVSCGTDLNRFHPDPSIDRAAVRRTHGLDPNGKLFLYVGRIDQEKRIDVLLRAIRLLPRDDIQIALAGQGAALNRLQTMSQSLGLGDRVRFLGRVPNEHLNQLLNSSDVFALASEAELLSIASLEAMAAGRPLLLADAGALPELVTPGVNGYLFRAGDARDAAHYMGLLADQPALREQMGRASRERVRPHSMEFALQTYAGVYRQVLENAALNTATRKPAALTSRRDARPAQNAGEPISAAVRTHGRVKRES